MLPAPCGPEPTGSNGLLWPHSCGRAAPPNLAPPASPRVCKKGQPARGVSSVPALRKNGAQGTLYTVGLGCKQLWGNNERTTSPGEQPMSWGSGKSTINDHTGSRASRGLLATRHQLLQSCARKTEKPLSVQDTQPEKALAPSSLCFLLAQLSLSMAEDLPLHSPPSHPRNASVLPTHSLLQAHALLQQP